MRASLRKLSGAELLLVLVVSAGLGCPAVAQEGFTAEEQQALAAAADVSMAFAAVARVAGPAVVNISTTTVVAGATKIQVKLADNREFEGKLLGADPATDLAVVKIEGADFPYVRWGDASGLKVGEWVVSIGSQVELVCYRGRQRLAAVVKVAPKPIDPQGRPIKGI